MSRLCSSLLLLALFALLLLGATGCSTPENASVRPWNSPEGWENGLPSSMYENH
jgi:hypothetical protein